MYISYNVFVRIGVEREHAGSSFALVWVWGARMSVVGCGADVHSTCTRVHIHTLTPTQP